MVEKIIWQTHKFKYEDLPEIYLKNSKTWIEGLPGWEYRYFSDIDVENFIKEFYPQYLIIYNSIKPGMYRADIWRYLVVYKYGGIYADMDSIYSEDGMHGEECSPCKMFLKSYPIEFSGKLNVCVEHETNGAIRDVFTQAVFMAGAGDPVLGQIIEEMFRKLKEISNSIYENTPDFVWILATGPEMYTNVVNKNLDKVNLACFPVEHGEFHKDEVDIDIHLTWNIAVD